MHSEHGYVLVSQMNPNLTEVTVIGDDDTGVLTRVTSVLFEHDVELEELDQQEEQGVFRVKALADTSDTEESALEADLAAACDDLDVDLRVRFPEDQGGDSVGILVTKESHCLEAMLDAVENGALDADVEVVIGNHSMLADIAEEHDVPFYDVGDENGNPDESEILRLFDEYGVDVVALARYIQILSPELVFHYENRIINVHPSLLPAFPGAAAYRQAVNGGARIAGATAHYVTPNLDQGPIITQRAFNVPDDAEEADLKEQGQPLEADALIEAIRLHVQGALDVADGRTYVDDADADLGLPAEIRELNPSEPTDRN